MTQLTEGHRAALAKYTIGDLEHLRDYLGYVPIKLTAAGVNVEALTPELANMVSWVGSNISEARDILTDLIEELRLIAEENTSNE